MDPAFLITIFIIGIIGSLLSGMLETTVFVLNPATYAIKAKRV